MQKRHIVAVVVLFLLFFSSFWFVSNSFLENTTIVKYDNAGILLGYLFSCFTMSVGIIAWFRRQHIRRWFRRSRFERTGMRLDVDVNDVQGMIIPVSRREQPEWLLKWLQPQHVSFIYTEMSQATALELAKEFSKPEHNIRFYPGVEDIENGRLRLENVDKPEECKALTKEFIYGLIRFGVAEENIFVDTTGGKVPMSIGAFQAAEELGVSTIYVVGSENGLIKEPNKKKQGQPVFISDRRDK